MAGRDVERAVGRRLEQPLPELRPDGVGALTWAAARVSASPGLRYGLLLFAMAAGLVGCGALLAHAINAPSLRAYDRSASCGVLGYAPPSCRVLLPATIVDDRPLPLRLRAVTVSVGESTTVAYGLADTPGVPSVQRGTHALVTDWQGRPARIASSGLVVEPFAGPPGLALLLVVVAILSELACAAALVAQGFATGLTARALPGARVVGAARSPVQPVFLGALLVALLAGRTGHWAVAAPLHALSGLVAAFLLGCVAFPSLRAFAARLGERGRDGLSDDAALRLGGDVTLAAVLMALCLSLAADLVVADVLLLPR